jgi:hypothetical protein
MSASDLARSAGPTVAEILAKLGTYPKTGLNSVQLRERLVRTKRAAGSSQYACRINRHSCWLRVQSQGFLFGREQETAFGNRGPIPLICRVLKL